MKFFKLTKAKPTSGLMRIRPDDQLHLVNRSSNIPLNIKFSTTDGQSEEMQLIDEVTFQNSPTFLKRSYFRMEVVIQNPKSLSFSDEVMVMMEHE